MIKPIETLIYEYNKDEFMPVYRDGELDNRREFAAYKISKLLSPIHDNMMTLGNKINYLFANSHWPDSAEIE